MPLCITHNSQYMKTAEDRIKMWCTTCNGILCSHEEEENPAMSAKWMELEAISLSGGKSKHKKVVVSSGGRGVGGRWGVGGVRGGRGRLVKGYRLSAIK